LPQAHPPQLVEYARADPRLEVAVGRRTRAVFPRHHLPLASGSQHVQDAIENDPVRCGPPSALGTDRMVWNQRRKNRPELLRHVAPTGLPFPRPAILATTAFRLTNWFYLPWHTMVLHDHLCYRPAKYKKFRLWDALLEPIRITRHSGT
jgi:hypothetical protein